MRLLLSTALALVLASTILPASARDLGSEDDAAVKARIESFTAAFASGNFDAIVDAMPAKLVAFIAGNGDITVPQLEAEMSRQLKAVMSGVEMVSFGMDMSSAETGVSSEGRPYALIPTETIGHIPDVGTQKSNTTTLALKDGDTWYLLRIDNSSQVDLVHAVYPDLVDVNLPKGTSEWVDK